jgi:hypothetical protein
MCGIAKGRGAKLGAVIPVKAAIQANRVQDKSWIPACAGMTTRDQIVPADPDVRKIMNYCVVRYISIIGCGYFTWPP